MANNTHDAQLLTLKAIYNLTTHNSSIDPRNTFEEYNPSCGVYDFIIEVVVMGILCIFGFTGNTLSIVCLMRDRSKTATPLLLVSLEVADSLFLVTVVILRILTSVHQFYGLNALIPFMVFSGAYVFPAAQFTMTLTIYLTILVTANRYFSVCRPYQASNLCSIYHAKRHIFLVCLFSLAFNLPRFFEYKVTHGFNIKTNRTDILSTTREFVKSDVYQVLYSNVIYSIVNFLVPLITLIFMNYRLIIALREAKKKRAQLIKKDRDSNSRCEEDITLILIVVVLVFIICQTPALVTQILYSVIEEDSRYCPRAYFFYERISDLLVVCNSSLNFLVYCFCSRRFRQILVLLIFKRKAFEISRNGEISLLPPKPNKNGNKNNKIKKDTIMQNTPV